MNLSYPTAYKQAVNDFKLEKNIKKLGIYL
jgi:hypothetical protein